MSIPWEKYVELASTPDLMPGTHLVEAEAAELKAASTGKAMIVVTFRFLGAGFEAKRVKRNFVVAPGNPTALRLFFTQMSVLGVTREFLDTGPTSEQIAERIIGKRCNAKVKIGMWRGEERPEIDFIKPPRGERMNTRDTATTRATRAEDESTCSRSAGAV